MKSIDPKTLDRNAIDLVGNQWMLVTAGIVGDFNTMTASWGTLGFLWNKPVAVMFVRPQRYTFEFTEREERFTLSFFGPQYRKELVLCGTKSGRDTDKVAWTGLEPYELPSGTVAFRQAELVLDCRKLYADFLKEGNFTDRSVISEQYPEKDYHKMYIGEIIAAWVGSSMEKFLSVK